MLAKDILNFFCSAFGLAVVNTGPGALAPVSRTHCIVFALLDEVLALCVFYPGLAPRASIRCSYPFVPVSPIAALSWAHRVFADLVELATYNAR